MHMHIGDNEIALVEDVCLILSSKALAFAKPFIDAKSGDGKLEDISGGNPKSAVVTAAKVYLSPISASTLASRANGGFL
jgi:hypothetical protein